MRPLPDPLSAAALAYLAAPSCVFLLGWLELPPGLAAIALLLIALYQLAIRLSFRPLDRSRPAIVFVVAMALLWAALGGAGHLVYANVDWATRDAVYADLILGAWPPAYGVQNGAALVLRTAMGYFLPPAALAKLTGIEWASTLLLAWTTLGVVLFLLLLPLPPKSGWRLTLLVLLVVFFSGMDFLGTLLVHGHVPIFPLPLEWWRSWTFSSLTAQLFWAPNHALALWLGTALFFRHRKDAMLPSLAVVLLPLLLLWTPFATIGLLPWFIWGTWRSVRPWPAALHGVSPAQWILAILLTAVVAALFASKGVQADFSTASPAGGISQESADTGVERMIGYIQFVGFEFLILAILLAPFVGKERQEFAVAVALLLVIPLIRFGPSNDWALRVSTPSLVILMIITLQVARRGLDGELELRKLAPVALILLIGAATPSFEFARALLWRQTPFNFGESLVEQQRGFLPPHYIGRLDNAALQSILRKPAAVPTGEARKALIPRRLCRQR